MVYFFIFILIIVLYCSYRNYILEESFANIIDNGSFQDGVKSSLMTGPVIGLSIIKMKNPGKTSFVMKQETNTKIKTRYQLKVLLEKNTSYKISIWVGIGVLWNGNSNIFRIKFHSKYNKIDKIMADGKLESTNKINKIIWEKRSIIFTVPDNIEDKADIFIGYDPANTKGERYFTDLDLSRHYPDLISLPIKDGIMSVYSSLHDAPPTSNIWKDLTQNGNDITFDSSIIIKNKKLYMYNNIGYGPSSDKLIINDKHFIILWAGEFNTFTKGILFELYANNDFNTGIRVEYITKVGIDSLVRISIGGYKIEYKVGIVQKHSKYTFVKSNESVFLYVDGYKIHGNISPKITYPLEINSKKMVLNKTGDLNAQLEFFAIYNKEFNKTDVNKINSYIDSYRVNLKTMERPDMCPNTSSISENTSNISIIRENTSKELQKPVRGLIKNKECPFIGTNNPCNLSECIDVNWGGNIDQKCQNSIKSYCLKFNDKNCCKYTDVNKNLNCNLSQKTINTMKDDEKNPGPKDNCNVDLQKYIRKDQIPCWGCNLE